MVESRRKPEGIQTVLNQYFPVVRRTGPTTPTASPTSHADRPVRARVVFELDGAT